MAFSKKRIIFGGLGTALAAGIAIASSNKSNIDETAPEKPQEKQTVIKVKLGTKYKDSLIGGEVNFWISRFEDLKRGNPKNKDLLEIQKLDIAEGLDKLRETCNKINGEDEDSELFEDFQKFCAMKNKDGVTPISTKNGFISKYSSFSSANRKNLSDGFAKIWDRKDESATEDWKEEMLNECKKLQEKMYVDDLSDKNFTTYCT
ncbi:hypothetical protein A6V39_04230 [Candidatus Mycoplasma haematobovis]|uniref:Uncharacterized protein n=1 Tax=Candidatus Mycoplasma haematobovis TaxID=432608 RepID=A0A1A9QDC6_9MOLU|nr:hypothetical protein [Candidatus Mycoplasma haematobovis]OAL10094.1 hypothetical protein A6V39_04230 [Candidatus Mycoplasma haematobovis]